MKQVLPRIVVGGLRGGCGKTLVSLGIARALRDRGLRVLPFKKGPDYVDAAWLSRAAGIPCRNLDVQMVGEPGVRRGFLRHAGDGDAIAVVEGARGLFDALDDEGTSSTARLAKLLRSPVVLVVDCTKVTRTVGAMVLGCRKADRTLRLAGVILNRVANPRHEANVRDAVEKIAGLPVLGALPRLEAETLPERHLGLTMPEEHGAAAQATETAARVVTRHVDLERILAIARGAPPLATGRGRAAKAGPPPAGRGVRVAVVRDTAFSFYYPENLEALEAAGAQVVPVSATRDPALPDVDALYVGGGFPETNVESLAANAGFAASVRAAVEDGLPVYAECGGAVWLGRSLRIGTTTHPMTGVLPLDFVFHRRPQGHGYTELEATADNPYFDEGEVVRGHEFHYTALADPPPASLRAGFRVRRGIGFGGAIDGIRHRQVLATYSHLHADGAPRWAPGVVRAAARYASERRDATAGAVGPESRTGGRVFLRVVSSPRA